MYLSVPLSNVIREESTSVHPSIVPLPSCSSISCLCRYSDSGWWSGSSLDVYNKTLTVSTIH